MGNTWFADFESGDMVYVFDPKGGDGEDGLSIPFDGWPTDTAKNIYLALKNLFDPEVASDTKDLLQDGI